MSAFTPHAPMPLEMLAYKAQIEKNKGLHVNFPYGIIYPPQPGDDNWKKFGIPSPLYIGLTIRGFFYAPERSTKTSEFRMQSKHRYIGDLYSSARITESTLYFDYSGSGYSRDSLKIDTVKINIPGYYSVAIRIHEQEQLAMHFNEQRIDSIYQRELYELSWEVRMTGSVHVLLSLHLSDEIGGADSRIPNDNLGSSYNIHFPALGVGSYCVLDCLVTDPRKQAILYIQQYEEEQGTSKKFGAIHYNFTGVAQNQTITFYIRSSSSYWLVATSFDSTPKRIDRNASKEYTKRIHTSVSNNLQIVRKYLEPGAERYD